MNEEISGNGGGAGGTTMQTMWKNVRRVDGST